MEKTEDIKLEYIKMKKIKIADMKDQIMSLFNDEEDRNNVNDIVNIDLKIPIGMSDFQIRNFVLNRKEFCSPLFQYRQAMLELYSRINTFIDFYYQIRQTRARILLSEGKIEDIKSDPTINYKIKEAKIELQKIEIERNRFRLFNIEIQIKDKLRETLVYYDIYKKYSYIERLPKDEIDKMEEESWKIKSVYYKELMERYGLTPKGFIELPHEHKGLQGLLEIMNNNHIKKIGNNNTL